MWITKFYWNVKSKIDISKFEWGYSWNFSSIIVVQLKFYKLFGVKKIKISKYERWRLPCSFIRDSATDGYVYKSWVLPRWACYFALPIE